MILPLPVTFTTIGIDIGIDIPVLPIYMGNGDNMSDSQYTYTLGHILVLGVVFFQIFFVQEEISRFNTKNLWAQKVTLCWKISNFWPIR